MYEVYEKLRNRKGVTDYQVAKDTGITTATLSSWKKGTYTPKQVKMQKLADYFGVSLEYMMTGKDLAKQSTSGNTYYFSDKAAEIAQELFDNPDLMILFDAARGCRQEDLQIAARILEKFKKSKD